MVMKGRWVASELRLRKRRRPDLHCKELGCFFCLQSRYTARSHEERIAKKNEAVEATQKLLQLIKRDGLNFAHCRSPDATNVCRQSMKLSVSSRNIHGNQYEILLFGHNSATQVLHAFIRIIPDTAVF